MKPTQELPPGYVALVKRLVELIQQWCGAEPGLPDLRWLDPGDTAFVGALRGEALKWLADSPDAFRLLRWLDEKTDHKATLIQATVALRHLGHLPGGLVRETVKTSAAAKAFEDFAFETGTDTQLAPTPCPYCGKELSGASGDKGKVPTAGALSICCYCDGFLQFADDLSLVALTDAELAALSAENRDPNGPRGDTKTTLVADLEAKPQCENRDQIIAMAKRGAFHDYDSEVATPKVMLYEMLLGCGPSSTARSCACGSSSRCIAPVSECIAPVSTPTDSRPTDRPGVVTAEMRAPIYLSETAAMTFAPARDERGEGVVVVSWHQGSLEIDWTEQSDQRP